MRSLNWHKSFPYGCSSNWFGWVQLPPLRVPGCFPRQGEWRGWCEEALPLGKGPAMEELCSLGKRGNFKGNFCRYCLLWARPWQWWLQIWADLKQKEALRRVSLGSVTWWSVHGAKDMPGKQGRKDMQGKHVLRKHQQLIGAMETRSDFILKLRAEHFGNPLSSGVREAQTCCSPAVLPEPPPQLPALHPLLVSKKNQEKKSHIMLSSRSLSPHLCQSPD